MEFKIEAFTHQGTARTINEDAVLVHDQIMQNTKYSSLAAKSTRCFVADGVGGSPGGDQAAHFILERLLGKLLKTKLPIKEQFIGVLNNINRDLINFGKQNPEFEGLATTLAGIVIHNLSYCLVNAGDSVVLLYRSRQMMKPFTDQQIPTSGINIPITNYFGGFENALKPRVVFAVDEIVDGDIFIVATDGIFKVFSIDRLGKVLSNNKTLKEKSDFLLFKSLQIGSPDNISCILIEACKDDH